MRTMMKFIIITGLLLKNICLSQPKDWIIIQIYTFYINNLKSRVEYLYTRDIKISQKVSESTEYKCGTSHILV